VWYEERAQKGIRTKKLRFNLCCQEGIVQLTPLRKSPEYLNELLSSNGGQKSRKFKESIRPYNSVFAFTSIGSNVDKNIYTTKGPYVYRICGQHHHRIGSLISVEGENPKVAQLYIVDTRMK
jgi:hypothetical protein